MTQATPGQAAYFQERLKARVYEAIINALLQNPSITPEMIAKQLDRQPEEISEWLSGPCDLTLEAVSDLFLMVCGGEPSLSVLPVAAWPSRPDASAAVKPTGPVTSEVTKGADVFPIRLIAKLWGKS